MSRQDIENSAAVRIKLAEGMARTLGFSQIIVFGHHPECGTVVTTWGDDAERAAQAAAGANAIKKQWGWPEDTIVESAKVQELRDRIVELEKLVGTQFALVHVIEGTEYERGWGQRPDGYAAFKSREDAEAYIDHYNRTHNTAKHAPDCYTTYQYLGEKPASAAFSRKLAESKQGLVFFERMNELRA